AFGRGRQARDVGTAQYILTGRRKKHVEAAELRVPPLRAALFGRKRRLGEQVALRWRVVPGRDNFPPALESSSTVIENSRGQRRRCLSRPDEQHRRLDIELDGDVDERKWNAGSTAGHAAGDCDILVGTA